LLYVQPRQCVSILLQHQYFRLVHSFDVSRCMQIFWRFVCCTIHPRYLRGYGNEPSKLSFFSRVPGAITPGFLIVTSMFYTREEQTRRIGYWCRCLTFCLELLSLMQWNAVLMNGIAIIFLGFVAFGVLHTKVWRYCLLSKV
jgi:hypothetical protein